MMARLLHAAAVIAVAIVLAPNGARAQFDSIFGPLRPPGSVPNGARQPVPVDPAQQAPNTSPQGGRFGSPDVVQSRPLPPPPGVAVIVPISPAHPPHHSPPSPPPPRAPPQPP